jgi:YD repeat-containing protein
MLLMDKITYASVQVTTLSYEDSYLFKITKITDPFGRSAKFQYDASHRLIGITDAVGITSEFTYDVDGADGSKSDFIVKLKTPYGDTTFTKTEPGNTRSLETLYPDGNKDRVEYNQSPGLIGGANGSDPPQSVPGGMATRNEFLSFRNTFYWDKQAFAHAAGDHTKAKIYHWLHSPDLQSTEGILESTKEPLEGRVWYDYDGQGLDSNFSIGVGSTNKPAHVGRVLDDGSTQRYTYEYNGFGNVTKTIDPVGRTFSYTYAENGIDLLAARQTRGGQSELLSQMTYNGQHRPLTSKDAAGQTTTYIYNASGQIRTVTNANNDRSTDNYTNGFLTSIDGPLAGATVTFTYDSVGRVRTKTDVDGYTLTFEYDNLDRLTKITFPDSTFTQFTYFRLDRTQVQGRAGQKTSFEFNSVRQMTKRTDPLNRVTRFEWCKCGALRRLTDPMGRTTTWRHDVQGRVKYKEYTDGFKVSYLYENTTSRLRQRIDEKLQVTQYNYYRDNAVVTKLRRLCGDFRRGVGFHWVQWQHYSRSDGR